MTQAAYRRVELTKDPGVEAIVDPRFHWLGFDPVTCDGDRRYGVSRVAVHPGADPAEHRGPQRCRLRDVGDHRRQPERRRLDLHEESIAAAATDRDRVFGHRHAAIPLQTLK